MCVFYAKETGKRLLCGESSLFYYIDLIKCGDGIRTHGFYDLLLLLKSFSKLIFYSALPTKLPHNI